MDPSYIAPNAVEIASLNIWPLSSVQPGTQRNNDLIDMLMDEPKLYVVLDGSGGCCKRRAEWGIHLFFTVRMFLPDLHAVLFITPSSPAGMGAFVTIRGGGFGSIDHRAAI